MQSTFGRWALASLAPESSGLHAWSAIVAALVVGVRFAPALAPTLTQARRVDPRDALRG